MISNILMRIKHMLLYVSKYIVYPYYHPPSFFFLPIMPAAYIFYLASICANTCIRVKLRVTYPWGFIWFYNLTECHISYMTMSTQKICSSFSD